MFHVGTELRTRRIISRPLESVNMVAALAMSHCSRDTTSLPTLLLTSIGPTV
jgi:hypothetical protein